MDSLPPELQQDVYKWLHQILLGGVLRELVDSVPCADVPHGCFLMFRRQNCWVRSRHLFDTMGYVCNWGQGVRPRVFHDFSALKCEENCICLKNCHLIYGLHGTPVKSTVHLSETVFCWCKTDSRSNKCFKNRKQGRTYCISGLFEVCLELTMR